MHARETMPSEPRIVVRVVDDPGEIDAAAWDSLVAAQPSATPFVSIAYLRALHDSASAVGDTGWAPQLPAARARRRARRRVPALPQGPLLRRVRLRLGLGRRLPAPRPRATTRSCWSRCRSRRCRGRACCAHDRRRTGCSLLRAIEQLARDGELSSVHLLFLDDADQAAARASGLVDAQRRCSSTGPTASPRLRRLRRLPRQPAAREAQEDPAGAAQGRRRRRHVQRRERRRDRAQPTGTSSTAATPSPTRAPLDAVPDARLLRAHRRDDAASTGAVRRLARRPAGSPRR